MPLLRSEEVSVSPDEDVPDWPVVLPEDLLSFLEVEPDLALVVEDLLVDPVVLLPELLLFGVEPVLPEVEELPLVVPDVLPEVVEELGVMLLLDELPDWLEFWSVLWFFSVSFIVLISLVYC